MLPFELLLLSRPGFPLGACRGWRLAPVCRLGVLCVGFRPSCWLGLALLGGFFSPGGGSRFSVVGGCLVVRWPCCLAWPFWWGCWWSVLAPPFFPAPLPLAPTSPKQQDVPTDGILCCPRFAESVATLTLSPELGYQGPLVLDACSHHGLFLSELGIQVPRVLDACSLFALRGVA